MVEGGHRPRNRPPTLGTTSVDFYHYPVTEWAYTTTQLPSLTLRSLHQQGEITNWAYGLYNILRIPNNE